MRSLPHSEQNLVGATVRALADGDMSITRAAAQLRVHPNTVRYRLARISDATGLDPRTFGGLVDLVCVLELDRPQSSDAAG